MALLSALRRAAIGSALALALLSETGCAGHERRVKATLEALDRNAPEQAIAALDEELGVAKPEDVPAVQEDEALLLLDRASVQLARGQHKLSARDFGAADQGIEVLDLSTNAAADIGKYVFSDDSGPYKAPAYEKLLLNTLNLLNYLAMRDLGGARVEARRLATMQAYVKGQGDESALLGLGSYLAGLAFEKSGRREEALLHYDEALRFAQYRSLRDPLRTLTQGKKTRPGIDALVGEAGALAPLEETGEAEIIVVLGFGRVPQKMPVRIPIGMALALVARELTADQIAQANALVAQGAISFVNYPTLGPGRGGYEVPSFGLDGKPQALEQALDIEAQTREAWHKREGTIVLSAITRLLARGVAGAAVQGGTTAAINAASSGNDNRNKDGAAALGMLLGMATNLTLSVLDTPDTRSWSTLPARVAIGRVRVPAGKHKVKLSARGMARTFDVDVPAGGWAVLPYFILR
ncbi:hypothetical protein [Polyangium aurulentum]|uniref:hypothetical protein n=1 Tax=Polyangium aurulentum TaxID=2567896 RepID=UPI0010AEB464|nr:hypothetical protein [Polyangium aurulentum]UQA61137.1 hypothetical protein E8A73_011920 [Polyangium aurulentum]